MAMKNLEDAFVDELRDLLNAEKQIARALPRMARKCENDQLRRTFEEHQRQTEDHAQRLEQVFELLDRKPRGKKCEGIEGILSEGKEIMQEAEPDVMDAALIAAAQKVEHYEIASYGTVCTWAEQLGCDRKVLELLKRTLAEEKETDQKLTRIAEQSANRQAAAVA
ncbi:MAG TPA: ferritin-like domain-containing protein [Planctomycetaceae bacterium]|nr:ferritin-like domain-containing protein [Planctomycetaceae bacterium]